MNHPDTSVGWKIRKFSQNSTATWRRCHIWRHQKCHFQTKTDNQTFAKHKSLYCRSIVKIIS